MQDEQLQSGAIGTDPNENVQKETVAEGQDLANQEGSNNEQSVENLTDDSSKNQVEEGDLDDKKSDSTE